MWALPAVIAAPNAQGLCPSTFGLTPRYFAQEKRPDPLFPLAQISWGERQSREGQSPFPSGVVGGDAAICAAIYDMYS
ncbi:hypothetical protein SAMN04488527_101135 [Aliiroseovarius crassostreae]|nr:hypothetical protein SAMN04488527_101135 [Aliiroseovarius crassostreae]